MITLLCILLYLGIITSPNTYYASEIQQFETDNQQAIDDIMANQTLLDQIIADYEDDAIWIDIIDDLGGS